MADEKAGRWMRKIETAVEIARKVGRPLTFFAAIGFLLIVLIPTTQVLVPDQPTPLESATPSILALALIADIVAVLIWAKAKLAKDPKAFQDE